MSFFDAFNVSASGMTAQRLRMDVISQNIANVNTTRTDEGTPYKRKAVIFQEIKNNQPFSQYLSNAVSAVNSGGGVRVSRIVSDTSQGSLNYDPTHPDADENGYVEMPNVNIVEEMVNLISASRSYEANVTAMTTSKSMAQKTLEISK